MIRTISFAMLTMALVSCAATTDHTERATRSQPVNLSGNIEVLSVANNINVDYTPGPATSYVVTASENAKSKLKVDYSNGTLSFSAEKLRNESIKITLTAPAISTFHGMNNAAITVNGPIDRPQLNVDIYNNGSVNFTGSVHTEYLNLTAYNNATISLTMLETPRTTASAYNNATITLAGTSTSVELQALNNADINASSLKADTGTATAANNAVVRSNINRITSSAMNHGRVHNK